MSMFCPICHSLLRAKKVRGKLERYCPRCATTVPKPSRPPQTSPSRPQSRRQTPPLQARIKTHSGHSGGSDGLFPYPEIRDGQYQFLEDAREAFQSGKHLVAHAPTGIGKTAAVLTAALEHVAKSGQKIFFLTSKQSQHTIAVDTLRLIRERSGERYRFGAIDIISKQDMCPRKEAQAHYLAFSEFCKFQQRQHACPWFMRRSAELEKSLSDQLLHVEELTALCVRQGICPHRMALDAVQNATVLICDYNYLFSDLRELILPRLELDLDDIIVIVDEAHNLPDRICANLDAELTPHRIHNATMELRKSNPQLQYYLTRLKELVDNSIAALQPGTDREIMRDVLIGRLDAILKESIDQQLTVENFINALDDYGETLIENGVENPAVVHCAQFLRTWFWDSEGTLRMVSNWADDKKSLPSASTNPKDDASATPAGLQRGCLALRLLDPSVISKDVFRRVAASVSMSGTLYPPEMYADLMGLEGHKTLLRQYPSPFPPENRPVIITENLTTLYRRRNAEMYERFASSIIKLSETVPGNLAVFFPSYELMNSVHAYLKFLPAAKELLIEHRAMDKSDKAELLTRLERLKLWRGGILLGVLGGSMSEGVDYAQNLLSSIIIVGLPLAPPSLEVKALQSYYARKFGEQLGKDYGYIFPAMNKALQAIGRCIRSETDRAIIVLMDERYAQQRYRRCLPSELLVTVTVDPVRYADEFFS